ncbi:MAG: FGGY family carbohydrate kinase [Oscillospiraceae bacterium]|nr:FGGY family carbohydrate kinase [Oscillospiraceae bacterium]
MYYMGIDIGTSGCKIYVTDNGGKVISSARKEYTVLHPRPGWLELDAENVFSCVLECIREACSGESGKIAKKVAALSVSAQGEAIIPVDRSYKPIYNAILTFDIRNNDEYLEFKSLADKTEVTQKTGAPVHPMFSVTKIMWHKNKNSGIYDKAHKFLCFGDFISCRLGAEPYIDYTMAARTMAFNIKTYEWSDKLLGYGSIDKSKLPKAVKTGETIGKISGEISELTGLSRETLIIAGAHDQACCALGAGVTSSKTVMDSLGTTESILCVRQGNILNRDLTDNNIACYPYVIDNHYAYLSFLSCCGSIVNWYKNELLGGMFQPAELDILAAKNSAPSEIFVLPHFAGSGTPYLDFNSKGIITGLTLGTPKENIFKAILESTAYEMRQNISIMEKCGVKTGHIRCIGGGAKSALWLQIKSDVTGISIASMAVSEAGAYGAAMIAACGSSNGKNLSELAEMWVKEIKTYEPCMDKKKIYDEYFEKYKNLYQLSLNIR